MLQFYRFETGSLKRLTPIKCEKIMDAIKMMPQWLQVKVELEPCQ